LGPSQKTLRHPWCPKLVTALITVTITQNCAINYLQLTQKRNSRTLDTSLESVASARAIFIFTLSVTRQEIIQFASTLVQQLSPPYIFSLRKLYVYVKVFQ